MTWQITHHGRTVAKGSWTDIMEAGERRGLISTFWLGLETPDAVPGYRASQGVQIRPVRRAA
jgi:hypothetical protein